LQAVVLGNKSFLPRSRGDFSTALQLLDQAKRLVPDAPIVRSWAMALEAMTMAWAHEPAESLVTLEAAEGVLDEATADTAPDWFDYYDRPRLAGFKGQVHIRLAQPEAAHAVLEEAIGALDPDAAKQRACYLADQPRSMSRKARLTRPASSVSRRSNSSKRLSTRPASSESATFASSCGPGETIRRSPT
jgi:hypothetical protein